MGLRRWWPVAFIAIALAAAVWGAMLSPQHDAKKNVSGRATTNKPIEIPWPDSGGLTAIFTGFLTVSTILLYVANRGLLKAALAQSEDTAKSAEAMKSVANSMVENVSRLRETVSINRAIAERQKSLGETQLRAYVSVQIGTNSTWQDRANNIHFGAGALLVNSGATPAHKVRTRIKAALFPTPFPGPKDFDLIFPSVTADEDLIPPHSNRSTAYVLPDFCDDKIVADVKRAIGTGLFVWGLITYEDTFGAKHETRFCHLVTWLPPINGIEQVYGYYITGRNTMIQVSSGVESADIDWDWGRYRSSRHQSGCRDHEEHARIARAYATSPISPECSEKDSNSIIPLSTIICAEPILLGPAN